LHPAKGWARATNPKLPNLHPFRHFWDKLYTIFTWVFAVRFRGCLGCPLSVRHFVPFAYPEVVFHCVPDKAPLFLHVAAQQDACWSLVHSFYLFRFMVAGCALQSATFPLFSVFPGRSSATVYSFCVDLKLQTPYFVGRQFLGTKCDTCTIGTDHNTVIEEDILMGFIIKYEYP